MSEPVTIVVPGTPVPKARPRGLPICNGCSKENDREGQRYCKACHATYMRSWRKTHPLDETHKRRSNARSYAREYRKRDHLVVEPCLVCGSGDAEMHHPDHELPLAVVWLCRSCHLSWHAFWRQVAMEAWRFWHVKSRAAPRGTDSAVSK